MGFPSFVANGALATNITTQSMPVAVPTGTAVGDILIAQIVNKALSVVISPPSGWTEIIQGDADCTTAADDHRAALFYKRAGLADLGASPAFTKASGTVLFAGVMSAWRGCTRVPVVIDSNFVNVTVTAAASDTISFPTLDPHSAESHIVYFGFYGNDLTTMAAAMSVDTNPDCTTRYDLETASGNDVTLCCTSGNNNGTNTGTRTWATASTTDAGSTGMVLALVGAPVLPNNYWSVRVGDGMSTGERIR